MWAAMMERPRGESSLRGRRFRVWRTVAGTLLGVGVMASLAGAAPGWEVIRSIDLTGPFGTRSAWQFEASQGPPVDDVDGSDEKAPGAVAICLRKGGSGVCDPALNGHMRASVDDDLFAEAHELERADIVHPRGPAKPPLLLVVTGNLHSANGDQLVRVRAVAYSQATDQFVRAYDHATGRNNNQEIRYMPGGLLAGDIVAVEPTQDAPFGYWVSVSAPGSDGLYREVLRYRSETHYGDGNTLAVIDSEMPATLRHLGLWQPGSALPLPADPCPRPHLVGMVLWCS